MACIDEKSIRLGRGQADLILRKSLPRRGDAPATRLGRGDRLEGHVRPDYLLVSDTIHEVQKTLVLAFVLVVLVVLLGSFRATLIPTLAPPVSGTFGSAIRPTPCRCWLSCSPSASWSTITEGLALRPRLDTDQNASHEHVYLSQGSLLRSCHAR
jgi:AcrB/AcrD/AcrF family